MCPEHGCSSDMLYSFEDADAPERHDVQYFEMFGNRGIYFKGWTAVTLHRTPGPGDFPAFDVDVWELHDPSDWSQARDLSKDLPDKLHVLQRLWLRKRGRNRACAGHHVARAVRESREVDPLGRPP
jgi:arylsulfatase A-like enzyme